jgi:hypothetical protein
MSATMITETKDQSMTYTISVTVTRPIRVYDSEYTLADTAEWMAGTQAKRELEREVLRALRVLDGECDAEVMESAIVDDQVKAVRR